ncbi:MAG: galactokinase [Bacteroidota bacterium]|jgi:galactokinase
MNDMHLPAALHETFLQRFGQPDVCVKSPGRINLLGEHTDYNDGYVMPAAIDLAVYLAISKRSDPTLKWFAADLNQTYEGNIERLDRSPLGWPDYWLGAIQQLKLAECKISGFNAVVTADLPIGAGLSSSAALTCGILFALNHVFELNLPTIQLIKMAQATEHTFIGLQCGIMDQFANMMGREGQVILLDCRSLDHQYAPFDFPGIDLVLLDTGVKHSLAASAYNQRRQECFAGVQLIQKKFPAVQSLRDADVDMVAATIPKSDIAHQRCMYVVQENNRVLDSVEQLKQGNLTAFGKNMFSTHAGLRDQYAVSCDEADFLVAQAKATHFVVGARMMGGGFGGCTLNLIPTSEMESFLTTISHQYMDRFQRNLVFHRVRLSAGTAVLVN